MRVVEPSWWKVYASILWINQGIPGSNFIGPGIFISPRPGLRRDKHVYTLFSTCHFTLPLLAVTGKTGFAETSTARSTVMDEVVVSESRIAESKRELTANLNIISRETIEQSASRNLGDVLSESGFGHVQKYPNALTSISIRSFRTDTHGNDLQGKVLLLFDGRRAGSGNAVKVLTQNIERVEIIRGSGLVQYDSAGTGGVVNGITRTGTKNSLFVEGGGGSFDRYEGQELVSKTAALSVIKARPMYKHNP